MTEDRHEKLVLLFDQLIELGPAERSVFLDQHCGKDTALRDDLESLLSHHVEQDSLLDIEGSETHVSESGFREGNLRFEVGPYRVLRSLGSGGMGEVFLAKQDEPVRQKVALKVIKLGMNSKEIITRFESERQALALMDHPNIARVLGAGTGDNGQPYFAMEYVDGQPLTDYCDEKSLPIRERLKLFKDVCYAVQHAHQKAIIHRDLKPSNILVAEHDGRPVPKVIDFGLAKALGEERLTEKSALTTQGMIMGTPEYMSPEQADPSAIDIDTRTDVYSLGVILYRMLAGVVPLEMDDLRADGQLGALENLRRKICDEEPSKPSTRVASLSDDPPESIRPGHRTRASLSRRLRGDLDWITMKALEKDRNRRYATASDFAGDIEAHLNDEPVAAGPPSGMYRLKKLVRKNVGLVTALGVVFLALAVGGVVATVFYFRAEKRRVEAEEARERESEQKKISQQKERLALAREKEAIAARQETQRVLGEVLRLADTKRLQELLGAVGDLWPAYPEKVGAMEEWLERAKILAENLPVHEQSLMKLRELGVQRADHVSTDEEGLSTRDMEGEDVTNGDIDIEWSIDDPESRWRHSVLTELVAGLRRLTDPGAIIGNIAEVEHRLAFATTVSAETVEKYDVEWEEAIASIKNCPHYHDLELAPQIGLVPLGSDPDSNLWEFGHLQTGEIPDRDDDGKLIIEKETGLIFVLIPGGTFVMGAQTRDEEMPNYDPLAIANEAPPREVTLLPFFHSKYEMTQGQWKRFKGVNPSYWDGSKGGLIQPDNHPVEQVSWEDCQELFRRLGLILPTEAQWEYAARGGETTPWWTGGDRESLSGLANLADRTARRLGFSWDSLDDWPELDDGHGVHSPVGSYPANPFGLHDVMGNVWEWCRDSYTSYQEITHPGDGLRGSPGGHDKMCRGGGFSSEAFCARSTYRYLQPKDSFIYIVGVRPSRRVAD